MPGEVAVSSISEQGVVHVHLRHDGRLNAMSRAMWRQLRTVFEGIQNDADARCVVLQGAGNAFCAGGDISEYPEFRFDAAQLRAFHEDDVWGGLSAILACDVPVIASIRGACMGAGVEIASCCDIRIAERGAKFGAPIAKLGFPMAPREAALVASAVGAMTARQMLLEAATLTAEDMDRRGFLSQLVDAEELDERVRVSARRISSLAPQAARLNKQTLRALGGASSGQSDPSDPYAYADSAEHREGIHAFLEKRPAVF